LAEYSTESLTAVGRLPSKTEEDRAVLAGAIGNWLSACDQIKWPRGLQYFENASMLLGNHLTRFYYTADAGFGHHQFGVHDRNSFDSLVAKTADNKLIRPVENVAAMLTQQKPMGRVVANSDLPEDEDAADLSEIVLDVLWEKPLNMAAKTREVAIMGCITGTVAVEIEYGETDLPVEIPSVKTRKVKDELTEEEYEEEYEDYDDPEIVWKNDIQARVWNSFHLCPDPAATTPEDMRWIARSSFEDIDWIKDKFDRNEEGYHKEKLSELKASGSATKNILYWWAKVQDIIDTPQYYHHGGGLTPQTFTTQGGYAPNQVVFTVVDVKPTAEFPEGRTLVLADGHVIYSGRSRAWSEKYPWRWHPYAFWGWFKVPGRFWHVALLSQLVPLQKKINAIDAQVHANRQFISLGQWMIPKHSKVAEGSTSGIPGQSWQYTDVPGMQKPERIRNEPLPQELLVERQQLERSIEFIAASGVTDPAVSPSGARAGVILDHLRQEKLRSKTPMIQEFEHMLETVCQNILIEIQLNLEEEDPILTRRIQAAAREHSSVSVETFTGASLRDHHNIKIDIASQLLKSPEAKEAKALEYLQYSGGQVTPVEREGIMQAIGLDEFVKNEEHASVRYARRLISRIALGNIPEVQENERPQLLRPGIAKAAAMLPIFTKTLLEPRFNDYSPESKQMLMYLASDCKTLADAEEMRALMKQAQMMQALGQGGQGQE